MVERDPSLAAGARGCGGGRPNRRGPWGRPGAGTPDAEGRRVFGDFRIVRELGRGGMGVVYEAQQLPFEHRVALKILPPAAALDHRALQRFELEAQVTSLLQHPRIVPLYSVGTIGDVPYYAMPYIEGGSLADLIYELRTIVEPGPDASGCRRSNGQCRRRRDMRRKSACIFRGRRKSSGPLTPTLSPSRRGRPACSFAIACALAIAAFR